ncbi:MAG: aspartate 1-decarboxylase [Planctomycetaceae bacterium]|nr:aspartate 1-decarboxylase [Planctomycetaceae bacterium]
MERKLLKSKIHRATVTDANLEYEGSVTIDPLLMEATDIVEWEQVDVYDITNGSRLTTYAISGERGSGVICLNGAAARLVQVGDLVIICSYATYTEVERAVHTPRIALVNSRNQIPRKRKAGKERS